MSKREVPIQKAIPLDEASLWNRLRRAYTEFLAVPTCVIFGFVVAAVFIIWADRSTPGWLLPVRDLLHRHVFADAGHTGSLLGMLTTGLITLTSITFSMLLLALQESTSMIGAQVVNSFIMRRRNQALLGFFLGLTLFVLLVHAVSPADGSAVLGAALSVLLAAGALYALAVLLFAALNQMRPQAVVGEVRTLTLKARRRQADLLLASYREPRFHGGTEQRLRTEKHGYVREIDLNKLKGALRNRQGEAEVEICVEIGDYVAYGEETARVRAEFPADVERLSKAAREAVVLDAQRAVERDPSFGVQQILMIGWSSASTAYHNPGIAMEAVRNLRDLAARWSANFQEIEDSDGTIPLVYPDGLVQRVVDAMEAIGIASTESLQFATFQEVVCSFNRIYNDLPEKLQERTEIALCHLLTGLGDHVLAQPLQRALTEMADTLRADGRTETADALEAACHQMAGISGELNARSTRAKEARKKAQRKQQKPSQKPQ